jgi:tyrosyl-tRNA synthetase
LNQTHYRELHDVKDSVKKTFESAEDEEEEWVLLSLRISWFKGYDFHHLYKEYNCLLQMGGNDHWSIQLEQNWCAEWMAKVQRLCGTLVRWLQKQRTVSKFGKSEGGNVWLTTDKTSVYKFYQFGWIRDVDAEKYIKIHFG